MSEGRVLLIRWRMMSALMLLLLYTLRKKKRYVGAVKERNEWKLIPSRSAVGAMAS